jgi:hypothetical protein
MKIRTERNTMENVREILFEVVLEGEGVVQTDHVGQKFHYFKSKNCGSLPESKDKMNDNISFAKADYYNNPDYVIGETKEQPFTRIPKISSDCLRHNIHEDAMPSHTPAIFEDDILRLEAITTNDYLMRGYLDAPSKNAVENQITKRKSSYMITDAKLSPGAISSIEVRSKSGPKNLADGSSVANSFFYQETLGKTTWTARGAIDISQLQFISSSINCDRRAIRESDVSKFEETMISKYGAGVVRRGYFYKNGSQYLAEEGFVISSEKIQELVNEFFGNLASLYIGKKNAFAKTSSIRIKYVENPLEDLFDVSENWIEIYNNSAKSVNVLGFNPHNFYSEADLELINAHKIAVENIRKSSKENEKALKESKAEAKLAKSKE